MQRPVSALHCTPDLDHDVDDHRQHHDADADDDRHHDGDADDHRHQHDADCDYHHPHQK